MALSLFDRIEIAIACYRGEQQFKKELREYDRAAGTKKNNKGNTPSYNSTTVANPKPSTASTVSVSETTSTPTKTSNTQPVKKKESKKVEKNEEPRTEQQMKAEAEYPAEEPGAEKIRGNTEVAPVADAAMSGNTRIGDTTPGVLDFSSFGVSIDLNSADQPVTPPTQMVVPNQFNPIPTQVVPNQFNPIPTQVVPNQFNPIPTQVVPNQFNPMFDVNNINPALQFNLNGMPGMNTYGNMLNQQPTIGQGRHKVDMPVTPKPPKPPKAEPDKVDMTGLPDITKDMVEYYPKTDVRNIGVLEDKVSKEVEKVIPTSIFPNNESLFTKYTYLQDIEKIALSNGYQICFGPRNTGLIDCIVCNQNGQALPNKGFVIDTGFIIDRRKKIFAGLFNFYEGMNAYPLFINGEIKDGKKASNVLNVDLIKGLIIGGNQTVDGVKGMYSEDFRNLNCIVALITIPTHKISPADRKYIQNRLVSLYKDGTFADILATNPDTRFRIADYNKSTNTIILDSDRVPKNFGGKFMSNEHIQIKITSDKCKVLRGENLINVPEEL